MNCGDKNNSLLRRIRRELVVVYLGSIMRVKRKRNKSFEEWIRFSVRVEGNDGTPSDENGRKNESQEEA